MKESPTLVIVFKSGAVSHIEGLDLSICSAACESFFNWIKTNSTNHRLMSGSVKIVIDGQEKEIHLFTVDFADVSCVRWESEKTWLKTK